MCLQNTRRLEAINEPLEWGQSHINVIGGGWSFYYLNLHFLCTFVIQSLNVQYLHNNQCRENIKGSLVQDPKNSESQSTLWNYPIRRETLLKSSKTSR